MCSELCVVQDDLLQGPGPVHSAVAVPTGATGDHDALISGHGTVHCASLCRSQYACALEAQATVPFDCAHATPFALLQASSDASVSGPILAVTSAAMGISKLCAKGTEGVLECCALEGFVDDQHTVCACTTPEGAIAQVTAHHVALIDSAGDGIIATWHPQAAISSAATCTTGIAVLAQSRVSVLSFAGSALVAAFDAECDVDASGIGLMALPLQAEQARSRSMLMVVGSRSEPRGMLLKTVGCKAQASSAMQLDRVHGTTIHETETVPVTFALAACAAAQPGTSTGSFLCVGMLSGEVLVYALAMHSSAPTITLVQKLTIGSTHISFVQLPHPPVEPANSAPSTLLVLSDSAAVLRFERLLCPQGAFASDCESGSGAACPPALIVHPVATDGAEATPLAACALGADTIVWSALAGGVFSGTLDARPALRHRSKRVQALPRALAYCSAIGAVACQVRLSNLSGSAALALLSQHCTWLQGPGVRQVASMIAATSSHCCDKLGVCADGAHWQCSSQPGAGAPRHLDHPAVTALHRWARNQWRGMCAATKCRSGPYVSSSKSCPIQCTAG